jgi:hypothetical protein
MDDALVERLAQSVHESFLSEQLEDGVEPGSAPAMHPWDELTDELREANRAQARAIPDVLASVGAAVVARSEAVPGFGFSPDELERLAQAEHVRFSQRRLNNGWRYGPVRDDEAKVHPFLVDWDDLPELERDKDRDAIRNIPEVLARAGLGVARLVTPRGGRVATT